CPASRRAFSAGSGGKEGSRAHVGGNPGGSGGGFCSRPCHGEFSRKGRRPMTSPAVISRYANALVDVLLGPNAGMQSADAVAQLRSFAAAVAGSPALRIILASPSVSRARKRLVIRRIAETLGLSRVIANFLLVLTDHGRAGALAETIQAIELLLDERL